MKKIALIVLILSMFHKANAVTDIATPTVSGHWTISGSPYLIHNDISINAGDALVIDPGVQVIFLGYYHIWSAGTFNAVGTDSLPITFDVQDTTGWYLTSSTTGGWGGMGFGYSTTTTSTSPDFTELKYCNFSHMKNDGLNIGKNMNISYCNIHDNFGRCVTLGNTTSGITTTSELSYCNFYNNYVEYGLAFYVLSPKKIWDVHHNQFYQNRTGMASYFIYYGNSTILFQDNIVRNNIADSQSHLLFTLNSKGNFSRNKVYENTGWKVAPLSFESSS